MFYLKVDWLDRLTFREIEMINESEKRNSEYLYLMIEFSTVQVDGNNVSVLKSALFEVKYSHCIYTYIL